MDDPHDYVLNIVNLHRLELFRYCRMLTGSEWDADDLVQETLMKLFAHGGASAPAAKAYVFRTATNAWIDICRKRKIVFDALPESFDPPAPETGDPIELEDRMETLLTLLSPGHAAVLLLVDVFGFSPKETADMVRSTEGAVRAVLHRSRKRIRQTDWNAGSGEPETQVRDARSAGVPHAPAQLIARFLEAFRGNDFRALGKIYLEMARNRIEATQQEGTGRMVFRFRDPEGQWCVIESENFYRVSCTESNDPYVI